MKGVGGELPPSDVFDQWAHYAIVYDGSAAEDNFKLYRDGDQGPNGGLRTWTVDSALEGFDAEDGVPGAVQIGAQTHPTLPPKDMSLPRNFHGNFDDVAIFNGALTKDEINNHGRRLQGSCSRAVQSQPVRGGGDGDRAFVPKAALAPWPVTNIGSLSKLATYFLA